MAFDPPRTPLRRGSQRFLNESRPFISSTSSQVAASAGLAALESAFHGIADELEVFVKNMQEMERVTEMFEETAESMAMFIQAQKMNTFCVEFPQAPTDLSFELAKENAERARNRTPPPSDVADSTMDPRTPKGSMKDEDRTFATNNPLTPVANPQPAIKRPAKPGAMTNKMKKERASAIDSIVNLLPIEFRGSDPSLRKIVETVIGTLMDAKRPLKVGEIATGPMLPQAKVNKSLIALVGTKTVLKTSDQGVSVYRLDKTRLP
ncbi:hypothetical protein M408DRAFT_330529 [Serendipita vermifera MAFF 305830]|uniref:DASH complex subunit DAM1 n=1 Tax=Serendipita vermifera MAFF 305830 TaxID=933852 RepID=A0A0C3B318_SERVB|nr:hypothetical protein M408DRAFT_330529 [Serendipita vermifera MAFF 305830]